MRNIPGSIAGVIILEQIVRLSVYPLKLPLTCVSFGMSRGGGGGGGYFFKKLYLQTYMNKMVIMELCEPVSS